MRCKVFIDCGCRQGCSAYGKGLPLDGSGASKVCLTCLSSLSAAPVLGSLETAECRIPESAQSERGPARVRRRRRVMIVMPWAHTTALTVRAWHAWRGTGHPVLQDVLNCRCLGTYLAPMALMAPGVARCGALGLGATSGALLPLLWCW